jgi:hypothetical protein
VLGTAFTTSVMPVLVALIGEAQDEEDVITHVTVLLFAKALEVYDVLLVPTFVPFAFHWYVGVEPPLVGAAVNVIGIPAHVGLEPDVTEMATAGVKLLLTVTVIEFDVAVVGEAQDEEDVITQVTILLVVKVLEVYEALFVPTFAPFTFH